MSTITWVIISTILCFVFSWWAYSYLKSIPANIRYTLILLRGLSLSLLAVVLINPIFVSEQISTTKKNMLILLDASESISSSRGSYSGIESYKSVISFLQNIDSSKINLNVQTFDNEPKPASLIVPEALGLSTNLESVLSTVYESYSDLDGIILVSDGVFNNGQDPSFIAQNRSEIPIFTVGLSDTNKVRDIAITGIDAPSLMYLNAQVPIDAKIVQNGYDGKRVYAYLMVNGKSIERKRITFKNGQTDVTTRFQYLPKTAGNVEILVKVDVQADEFSSSNNSSKSFASVAEDKIRIVFLAYGIHPDVKALTSALLVQKNLYLYPFYYARDGKYLNKRSIDFDPDTLEAIIVYGLPTDSNPELSRLKKWTEVAPTFWIHGPDVNSMQYNSMNVPLTFSRFSGFRNARFEQNQSKLDHPIFDSGNTLLLSQLPTIKTPYYPADIKAGTEVLMNADVGNGDLLNPILTSYELGNKRSIFFNGVDFYKLNQSSDEDVRTTLSTLFRNSVKWLSTRSDTRMLRVNYDFPDATKPGLVTFNALLFNESGEKEKKGLLRLNLKGADSQQNFTLQNMGNGSYSVNCGILPEGRYTYSVTANVGDRKIDDVSGEFVVSIPQLEFIETKQNRPLLERLAATTNGEFLNFSEIDDLGQILLNRNLYDTSSEKINTETSLFSYPLWFVMIVILLGTEWIIRKRIALP